ncbi:MAG: hypothetical protein EBS10_05745, partial [Acidimicrobiia bacterium]|nr:hypothetical protein [Acidimicrobiia bacterium]
MNAALRIRPRGARPALEQTAAMSRRAVTALVRQPSLIVPSLVFPLFFAALGTSSFGRAISIPGFPEVDSFLDFALAGSIVQGIMALRTGSSEAVQGSFPLLFVILFFSSAFFPRQTMDGAYRWIATLNPISYLVEGFRSLTIDSASAL